MCYHLFTNKYHYTERKKVMKFVKKHFKSMKIVKKITVKRAFYNWLKIFTQFAEYIYPDGTFIYVGKHRHVLSGFDWCSVNNMLLDCGDRYFPSFCRNVNLFEMLSIPDFTLIRCNADVDINTLAVPF